MRALRDRRVILALAIVVLAVVFQDQLVGLLWAPSPTFPASGAIQCGAEGAAGRDAVNIAGRQCFWTAYEARREAEFTRTVWSIEGDPIIFAYRIRPDGVVEVIVDSRQDRFSNREITFMDCVDLIRVDDPLLPDPIDFGPGDGCVERGAS